MSGSFIEIIRQRLFIEHDDKTQKRITVEYTIRSKKDDMKNIILHYDDYLPSLVVRDEKDNIMPLMASKDVKILYSNYIKKSTGEVKEQLEQALNDINHDKKYLLWISLKNNPMSLDEIRTFTLSYFPRNKHIKKPFIRIKINKQKYPLYYSLFSPVNFDFIKPKFIKLSGDEIIENNTPPNHVTTYPGYHTLSLRIKSELDDIFYLLYSLKPEKSTKFITIIGTVVLSSIPLLYLLVINFVDSNYFQKIYDSQIEIALFVIGASLILPKLQSNEKVRNRLIIYYLIPVILGLMMLFGLLNSFNIMELY